MAVLDATYSVNAFVDQGEVHFAASGLWNMDTMIAFQRELIAKSKPLIEKGMAIRSLGDLRGFVTQTREISDQMRIIVVESARLGVVKTAIIADSTLAKLQYKRLNQGINVEIFDTKSEAIAWLRA